MANKAGDIPRKYDINWLQQLDGRTNIAQEMRDRYDAFSDDLGGDSHLTYQQRSLLQRALWLEYWLSQQERKLIAKDEFEVGQWVQACNSLQGIYAKLGLRPRRKELDLGGILDQ